MHLTLLSANWKKTATVGGLRTEGSAFICVVLLPQAYVPR